MIFGGPCRRLELYKVGNLAAYKDVGIGLPRRMQQVRGPVERSRGGEISSKPGLCPANATATPPREVGWAQHQAQHLSLGLASTPAVYHFIIRLLLMSPA